MKLMKTCGSLLFLLLLSIQLVGITTVLSENFSGFTPANAGTDISTSQTTMDAKFQTTGWTGSKIYVETVGEAKIGSSSALGYVVTKTVNLSANSGVATLQFDTMCWASDTGKYIQVLFAPTGTTFTQVGSDIAVPTTLTTMTVNITGGTASSKIKITAKVAANNRFYLDNFLLTQTDGAITPPTLSTVAITAITNISASSGGSITSDGGAAVSARGVCWNTTGTPILSGSHTSDGSGSGSFTSEITGLTLGTTYHVRAYATNSVDTAYGAEIDFTTSGGAPPSPPTALAASSITGTSCVANWSAVSGANSYRLDVSPNISFSSYVAGYNDLTVTSTNQSVSGLSVSTNYYYRVRAVNTSGTSSNSGTITVTTSASDPYSGYYDPVAGLTGTALKDGLHNLIDSNTNNDYSGSKLYLYQTADNVSGTVRCVYTGQDFTINSSYDGATNPNTEHTFAQSWFGTTDASIKKADIHHLFPTDATVNSTRGNYPFDVVTTVTNTFASYNGYVSKLGRNAGGQTVFEPADQHKGDLARALLYFSVRYSMSLSISGVDMLPTMIAWNSFDPPDTKETNRNASIYTFMHNRNPFVDHPEYVSSIWGGTVTNTIIQFNPASSTVNENTGAVTLTVTIENPSASAATSAQIVLTDGLASDVNNYTTQTVTFPAGSSASRTITANVTDDAVIEGNETLVFTLSSITGGTSAMAGTNNSYNLTIIDNDIPTVTALTATNISTTGFTANWQAASGITVYEFDLSASNDFSTYITGYEALQVDSTGLVLNGLTPGVTYYYRVNAFFNETSGTSSNVITSTTLSLPVAPVAIVYADLSSYNFTAKWNSVSTALSYRFDVSLSNLFDSYLSGYQDLTVSSLTQAVTGLTPNTTYYYRVRAVNVAGASLNSNVIIVQTPVLSSASDLFISEYLEGSSNNKAIELYNPTTSTIDLSIYSIKQAMNGSAWNTSSIALSGTLASNSTYVISNSSANADILAKTNLASSALIYNGNDAVGLEKNGALIDVIGVPGSDPSTDWNVAGTLAATKDHTLIRHSTINFGDTNWSVSAGTNTANSEWVVYPIDTATYLGSHIGSNQNIQTPEMQITIDSDSIVLSWHAIPQTPVTYRVEAADMPNGTYSDVSSDGIFNETEGSFTWTTTLSEMMKFYHVIAISETK